MPDRNKVIKIAMAEVGYLEKSKSAYKKDPNIIYDAKKGAGQDNYTKYGYEMHKVYPAVMDFPAAWCDCFVDWCFYKAYGTATAKSLLDGNFDDYTVASKNMYVKKNAYYKSKPQIGDQIFFKNSSGTSVGHTGLVYNVDSKKVYTIEGNTSNSSEVVANGGCVAKKSYLLTNTRIDGYGRPNYNDEYTGINSTTSTTTTTTTSYYPKYTGSSSKVDEVLKAIGVPSKYYGSVSKRKSIAIKNNISNYSGTAAQNLTIVRLAKEGKLIKV